MQVHLTLPAEVVEYVLTLLNEQPRKFADQPFRLIQTQAQAQLKAQNEPKTKEAAQTISVDALAKEAATPAA